MSVRHIYEWLQFMNICMNKTDSRCLWTFEEYDY